MLRWIKVIAALLSLALSLGSAMAGPLDDALAAIRAKQFAKAVALLDPLAKQGDKDAQFNLGVLYLQGQGVSRDYTRALDLLGRAADQNDARAAFYLGMLYHQGLGTAQDTTKAMSLLAKSAEQGYGPAEYNLGIAYFNSRGVTGTVLDSFHWYRRAAEHGEWRAYVAIGTMYELGVATPPDYREATRWNYRGLTSGDLSTLVSIGRLADDGHLAGSDAAASKEIAYVAFSLAGSLLKGDQASAAAGVAKLVASKMTVQELSGAKARFERATIGGIDKWNRRSNCGVVDILVSTNSDKSAVVDDCTRLAALAVPVGEYNLGWINLTGYLVPQDLKAALKWLHLAAEADFAAAELVLGKELAAGTRLPKDPVGALGWFLVAQPRLTFGELIDKYHQDAVEGIASLEAQLTETQINDARAWADTWTKTHPVRRRPEVLDLTEQGLLLVQKDKSADAIAKFDAAIKIDPTYTEAYLYRSEAELRLGKSDLARADVEVVLQTDPENVEARFNLGQLKLSAGDAAGALADFNDILDKYPDAAGVIAKRADAYSAVDDYAAAAKDVAHVLRLVPSSAATNRPILADDLFRAGQFEAAAAEFHSLAADPESFGAAEFMISEFLSAWHAGRKDSAELARNEARLVDHKWPFPLFGYLLDRTGETALLASLSDKWAICEAKYIIGQKNLLEGKSDRAYRRFKEVVDTCPYDIPPVWLSQWYVRKSKVQ